MLRGKTSNVCFARSTDAYRQASRTLSLPCVLACGPCTATSCIVSVLDDGSQSLLPHLASASDFVTTQLERGCVLVLRERHVSVLIPMHTPVHMPMYMPIHMPMHMPMHMPTNMPMHTCLCARTHAYVYAYAHGEAHASRCRGAAQNAAACCDAPLRVTCVAHTLTRALGMSCSPP